MAIVPDQSRAFFGTEGLISNTLYLSLLGTAAMPTIAAGSVCGSFTALPVASGYVNATLAGTGWSASAASGTTTVVYGTQSFTFTGSVGNVQGYLISDAATG